MFHFGQIKKITQDYKFILAVYIIIAIAVSIQILLLGNNRQFTPDGGDFYVHYNNYVIFKQSFFHLISGKDMYIHYPAEYYDLYKYSPTFALFMSIFAYLPDYLGLPLWNLLNVTVLFWSIKNLPIKKSSSVLILLVVIFELVGATQNSQSNALLAGLIIGAFNLMNKGKTMWASLLLVLATYIKVYGAIGFCLFLFYPDKLKFILYSILWTVLAFLPPLLVTSPQILADQYVSWARMMSEDEAASYGLSVMGWLHNILGVTEGKGVVAVTGLVLLLIPFARFNMYKDKAFRLLILSSILIWVIIFNHKAESATFIIAMCGVGIWYIARPATSLRNIWLFIALILISISTTELFASIRYSVIDKYAIKPFGAIVTWVIVFMELMTIAPDRKVS